MKKLFWVIGLAVGVAAFVGAGTGFSQDTPKTGCPKQACFDKMDADKNGQISEAEFLENCKNKFGSMDTDKDGSLSKDEFKPCCMGRMDHPPKPGKGTNCPYMKKSMKE